MSGKTYDGEKAIISLTSWKARIGTVSKTIFSLLKQCPGFHIVLVLSEEEFPKKEDELPENLMLFVKNNLIEILWVYKNYKSLKKIIFTISKYKNVPVISADDDCIYTCNYAQELYNAYLVNKNVPIAYRKSKYKFCCCGPATLYPIKIYDDLLELFDNISKKYEMKDDAFVLEYLKSKDLQPIYLKSYFPCYFHDEINPINGSYKNIEWVKSQKFK